MFAVKDLWGDLLFWGRSLNSCAIAPHLGE